MLIVKQTRSFDLWADIQVECGIVVLDLQAIFFKHMT